MFTYVHIHMYLHRYLRTYTYICPLMYQYICTYLRISSIFQAVCRDDRNIFDAVNRRLRRTLLSTSPADRRCWRATRSIDDLAKFGHYWWFLRFGHCSRVTLVYFTVQSLLYLYLHIRHIRIFTVEVQNSLYSVHDRQISNHFLKSIILKPRVCTPL